MAGGVINTGSHPKLLWPGIHDIWGQVYDSHPKEYPDFYDQEESDRAYEQDVQITPFGLASVKPQGGGPSYDSEIQGPVTTYTPLMYALGYIVTYEEMKTNQYEVVAMRRAKSNAFSMTQTIENAAAVLPNNAFSTTYFTTADGVALCSTAHTNTTGGTFSNALSPAADLSESALEDICVQIMGMQNDRGGLISIMPRSLHISRQEWFNAHRILKSVNQPDTISNNINVLKATNAFPGGLKMSHYLTGARPWFVRTSVPNGLRMFWLEKPHLEQDNDFDTRNAKAVSFMWFSLGCTDPRGIVGCNAS